MKRSLASWLKPGARVYLGEKAYEVIDVLSNGRVLLKTRQGPMEVDQAWLERVSRSKLMD